MLIHQKAWIIKEFVNLKLNWMIKNKQSDLIEQFLNQNEKFYNKKKNCSICSR